MAAKFWLLLRGPVALLVVIGAIALLTSLQGHAASSRAPGRTAAPTPSVVPASSAVPTGTANAASPPTHTPQPAGPGVSLAAAPFVDQSTGMEATVTGATVRPAGARFLQLRITVRLHNLGAASAQYDRQNFYALAVTGRTYPTQKGMGGLGTGSVSPGSATTGVITFLVARARGTLTIIWNDNNALVPPASIGSVQVRG